MIRRHIFNSLRWIFLLLALLLLGWGASTYNILAKILLFILGAALLLAATMLIWWFARPNTARIDPALRMETWDVVNDVNHNSNTDMILVDGVFYMVHAVSPFHFADTGCHIVLKTSPDGQAWQELATFRSAGEDIRDPKLALIQGRLFLYCLVNRSIDPEPYATVVCWSEDKGHTWTPFQMLAEEGWLFWKPKTNDGQTWYVGAYWWEHGRSRLYATHDGLHFEKVADINQGNDRNDETDIEFLPDGRMIATARIEGNFKESDPELIIGHSDGCTKIFVAEPPYTQFTQTASSQVTRLDGPALFRYNGRIYAVGRFQPELNRSLQKMGSALARKRTALFEVRSDGLTWLSDVPSAGDTSYAGVAIKGDDLYFVYYTSPIQRDYPWIVGMFNPTPIRMARVSLPSLEELAKAAKQWG